MKVNFVLVALSVCFNMEHLSAQPKKNLKIIADTWCPINCSPGASEEGLFVDIARQLATQLNRTPLYNVDSWARSKKMIQAGQADVLVGSTKAETPDLVFGSKPWATVEFCFYTNPDSKFEYKDKESLRHLRVGTIQEYFYGAISDDLETAGKSKEHKLVIEALSGDGALERNLDKLLKGRLDAIAEAGPVMRFAMKTQPKYSKLRSAGCSPSIPHFGVFSSKNPDAKLWAKTVDEIIEKWESTGEMKSLRAKYGFTD